MNSYEYQNAVLGSTLSANAKLTALAISYHYNWKEASASFPSISTLVSRTSLSKATIHRAKNELVSHGYLISTRRFNDSNLYLPVIPTQSLTEMAVVSEGRTNNEYNNEVNNEYKEGAKAPLLEIIDLNQEKISLDSIWKVFEDGEKARGSRPAGPSNRKYRQGNKNLRRDDFADAEESGTFEELDYTRGSTW